MTNPVVDACLFQKTKETRHVGLNHLYYLGRPLRHLIFSLMA